MKIHKALKIKNRLAGEISTLQSILIRENSRRSDNLSKVDAQQVDAELSAKRIELWRLKGAIAKATSAIVEKLAFLEETKSEIKFFSSLPNREGEEIVNALGGKEIVKYTWTATFNRQFIDKKLVELQNNINSLQDEIDEFNAKTDIPYSILNGKLIIE